MNADTIALAWLQQPLHQAWMHWGGGPASVPHSSGSDPSSHVPQALFSDAAGNLPGHIPLTLSEDIQLGLQQGLRVARMQDLHAVTAMLESMSKLVVQSETREPTWREEAIAACQTGAIALNGYVHAAQGDEPGAAMTLFPAYQALEALLGNKKVHPADLWTYSLPASHGLEMASVGEEAVQAVAVSLEQAVLGMLRSPGEDAARALYSACLYRHAQSLAAHSWVWEVAVGMWDAVAHGMLVPDMWVKRMASQLLMHEKLQSASDGWPEKLLREMLFFCALAQRNASAAPGSVAPAWQMVCQRWGLATHAPGPYVRSLLHCTGPELVQMQSRIEAAAQAWSIWVGNEVRNTAQLQECLAQFPPLLAQYWPDSGALQLGLKRLAQWVELVPIAEIVPEESGIAVACVLLHIQAVLTLPDDVCARSAVRAQCLAECLDAVRGSTETPELPQWLAPSYRHWHDGQSVTAVLQELLQRLWDVEQRLDLAVRTPETAPADLLEQVRESLQPLSSTLSVLGMEQGVHTMQELQLQLDLLAQHAKRSFVWTDALLMPLAEPLVSLTWQLEAMLLAPTQDPRTVLPPVATFSSSPGGAAWIGQGGEVPALEPEEQNPSPHSWQQALRRPSEGLSAEDVVQRMVQARMEAESDEAPSDAGSPGFESTRAVADLHIPQPLLDVFQGEAEQGTADLMQHLQAWASQGDSAAVQAAANVAHSLAGCASAIGFTDLTELARAVEDALLHVQITPPARTESAVLVLLAGGNEFRRLIQQFAQGVLPQPKADVLQALYDMRLPDAPAHTTATSVASAEAPEVGNALDADWPVLDSEPPPPPEPEYAQWMLAGHADAVSPSLDAQEHDPQAVPAEAEMAPSQEAPPVLQASDVVPAAAIDAVDALDPDLFPIFEEESAELLPTIGSALRAWSVAPDQGQERLDALRALHTLKGSARLAGAMRVGEMAHRLESQMEALVPGPAVATAIEPLLLQVDALQAALEHLRAAHKQSPNAYVLVHASDKSEVVPMPASQSEAWSLWTRSVRDGLGGQVLPEWSAGGTPAPTGQQATAATPIRAATGPSVRVRAALLDRLINEAGEVLIARARLDARMGVLKNALDDLGGDLDRLRQQLRDLEVQAESQMQSRLTYSKDVGAEFDPLEFDRFTRVQELTRMMAESVNDVGTLQRQLHREVIGAEDDLIAQGRQAKSLQRDLLRTRMVELDSVSERLFAVVRTAAHEAGKQVRLEMTGGSIEMDRGVLERMLPAFEHLLRNCVAHGIEAPPAREAAGKPVQGLIKVQVQHEGNDVAIAIRDDGAGLDVARIQAKAMDQGLLQAGEVVDEARAAQLIFMPGFTTSTEVTGLSGRGIGMDVLRNEVQALGGRIETQSITGHGTAFRVVLPLTTAVTQVVMVRMGTFTAAVPANMVEMVYRLPAAALQAAYAAHALPHDGRSVPLYWGGAIWQQSARSAEMAGAGDSSQAWPVLVLRSAAQRIAVHVDEMLGQQEVVVKHLGPQMAQLPGLTGMSVLPSGAVALIYNPVALTAVYGAKIQALAQQADGSGSGADARWGGVSLAASVDDGQAPLVMVVDDSITVRRVTQRLLQRAGYRVLLASDGEQALEKLQQHQPALLLTDIEMPRMDGLSLVRHLRGDARWQDLPVIVITSRTAEKHRAVAQAMGVNHYLGKPYRDEELMGLVRHYAAMQPLASTEASPPSDLAAAPAAQALFVAADAQPGSPLPA